MPEQGFPTEAEFWQRLDKRYVERDLRKTLEGRAADLEGPVSRLGRQETVFAFVERLLPGAAVPAWVVAKFIDEHLDEPMGRSDEKAALMPRAELAMTGFRQLDEAAGGDFAKVASEQQRELLTRAEKGELAG